MVFTGGAISFIVSFIIRKLALGFRSGTRTYQGR